ncbi:MAG: BTAD domain-containing putative transcriptional regulator [Micromonosporaceae bacterium]
MPVNVRVGLLGPLEVTVDDRPVVIAGAKPRVLFVTLALAAGQPVSMESLADHIWADALPADVRGSLYTVIRRLRQTLGAELVEAVPGAYLLRVAPESVDVHRFRSLVIGSRDGEDELAGLEQALGLWRGEALEDVPSEQLRGEYGPRLTEEWFGAVERRIDLLLDAGRHPELVGELRDLTARHPLREALWARLITALYRCGRQADALGAYRALRDELREQLGLDPSTRLQRLHQAVLTNDPSLDAAPRDEPAPPPADTVQVRPQQLPSDIVRFTGRERELAALDRLLPTDADASPPIVIAAVDGTGGIGKTSLAVHWAHRVADQFPDGQLYVNLRGFGPGHQVEPGAALETLLRSLGIPAGQIPPDVDSRSALLRTTLASRRVLLLLDNARGAEQVRPLLPGSSSLVLVTSRNQLRGLAARDGAHRVTLDHLTEQESIDLLAHVIGVERAAAESAAVTELARLCDYLPLPLAIAAERATRQPASPLHELAEELRDERDRLDALDTGEDPATDLRAVFSWSYRALTPEVARMLRLLAIAPGTDITAEAAAALAGATPVRGRRLLDALADTHQLHQRRPGRYELHDLLRAYAAELSEQTDSGDERAAARRRVLDWYMHAGWKGRDLLHPSISAPEPSDPVEGVVPPTIADDRQALQWFDAERFNLKHAVQSAYDEGFDELCWRLAHVQWVYLDGCQAWDDIDVVQGLGLAATRRLGDRRNEAETLTDIGNSCRGRGDLARAMEYQHAALAIFRELGDELGIATALSNLGAEARALGRYDESLGYLHECLAIDRTMDEPGNLAVSLHQLGRTYSDMGRAEAAIEAASEALDLVSKLQHRRGEARVRDTLSQAYEQSGDLAAAVEHLRKAEVLYADLGDHWSRADCLAKLGRVLRRAEDLTGARAAFGEAIGILERMGVSGADELRAELASL